MKKSLLALAAAAATLAAAPASAAIVVSMNPSVQSVAIGDSFSVEIRISGLGDEILSYYDINVFFDATLAGGGQGITKFLAPFGGFAVFDDGGVTFESGNNGAVGGSLRDDNELAGTQADDFVFLRFSWTALADGALFLSFGPDPDFERNVVGRDALSLAATFQGACVAIGTGDCTTVPVPEPSTYALAGLALLGCGLGTTRRRRQNGFGAA